MSANEYNSVSEGKTRLQVTFDIDNEQLKSILTNAVEGGCDYWANVTDVKRQDDLSVLSARFTEQDASRDSGKRASRLISWKDIGVGVERACGRVPHYHVDNALNENDDAETADVIIQMLMFGDIVYG